MTVFFNWCLEQNNPFWKVQLKCVIIVNFEYLETQNSLYTVIWTLIKGYGQPRTEGCGHEQHDQAQEDQQQKIKTKETE